MSRYSKPVSGAMTPATQSLINGAVRSAGEPLSDTTANAMSALFCRDFSDVRIHTDSSASLAARSIDATAFTIGNHIAFADGAYSPTTIKGNEILVHELCHVAQSNKTDRSGLEATTVASPDAAAEREAQHVSTLSSIDCVKPTRDGVVHRYLAPTDIADYASLLFDIGERVYLVHFYEGDDKEFQLAMNTLYTVIDLLMAAMPGGGGGAGFVGRASSSTLAAALHLLPEAVILEATEQFARKMGWPLAKATQFMNMVMRMEGSGGGGGGGVGSSDQNKTSQKGSSESTSPNSGKGTNQSMKRGNEFNKTVDSGMKETTNNKSWRETVLSKQSKPTAGHGEMTRADGIFRRSDGGVTAVENKSRDFTRHTLSQIESKVMNDIYEAVAKYGGAQNLARNKESILVDELILNYDRTLVPEQFVEEMKLIGDVVSTTLPNIRVHVGFIK